MNPAKSASVANNETPAAARRDTLSIVDNRTGRQYEIPVKNDTIRPIDLRQIKVHESDFGMMSYDQIGRAHV
jgi:citrate synthase